MSEVKTPPKAKLPEIKLVAIGTLKPYALNAKEHPEEQVDRIAKSMQRYGFRIPLLIDGKTMEIIAGHGRWLAATKLGYEEVPCIFADDMTPEEVKAFRIADNRVSESTMNVDFLLQEIENLYAVGYDLEDTGYKLPEIENLKFLREYGEEKPPEEEQGKAPTEKKPVECPECGHSFVPQDT